MNHIIAKLLFTIVPCNLNYEQKIRSHNMRTKGDSLLDIIALIFVTNIYLIKTQPFDLNHMHILKGS